MTKPKVEENPSLGTLAMQELQGKWLDISCCPWCCAHLKTWKGMKFGIRGGEREKRERREERERSLLERVDMLLSHFPRELVDHSRELTGYFLQCKKRG